jgi:hypothetical protein
MSNELWLAIVLLASFAMSSGAHAREVVYGKARETLPIAFGIETLLRFPMEVKTITEAARFEIRPANMEEPDYSVLVVKPRMSEGTADVTFILSDESVIRTQLVISNRPNVKRDTIYDFKPRDELADTNPNLAEKRDPMVISELDLMRAMLRRAQVAGFDVRHHSQSIALESPLLSATLVKTYTGRAVSGFIYILKTEARDRVFEIDLRGLAIGQPNLAVLAQIDRNRLGGESPEERQAVLRIVARSGASSHRVILPVAIRAESKGGPSK